MANTTKKTTKKSKKRIVAQGNVHIKASYNNTIVTITEQNGDVIAWSSSGTKGFKGARKSTPYAAQVAAEDAVEKSQIFGLQKVDVYIKGIGPGKEQAVRGLTSGGLELLSITDITGIPHNGCRQRRVRRT